LAAAIQLARVSADGPYAAASVPTVAREGTSVRYTDATLTPAAETVSVLDARFMQVEDAVGGTSQAYGLQGGARPRPGGDAAEPS
jgi:hypothetical protein